MGGAGEFWNGSYMADEPVLVDAAALLRFLAAPPQGEVSRAEAAKRLGCSEKQAGRVLRQLEGAGVVKRFGARWYPPTAVTDPLAQRAAVEEFLRQNGFAYRAEIAKLLALPPEAAGRVLRRMAQEGCVTLEGQVYRLP